MRLRKLGIAAITTAVFAGGLWAGIGSAGWLSGSQAMGLTAKLGPAAEVPKPKGVRPGATGSFNAGLTRRGSGGTLSWKLTFRGLTGRAAAAHIHVARPGVAGPVAVGLCGPCRSGARGTARVNKRTFDALVGGRAYVNVHTARNAAGEIRGQVRRGGNAVPAPTTPTTTGTTIPEPPPYPYP